MLADDLMWSSRIVEAVRRAGGQPVTLTSADELEVALGAAELDEAARTVGGIVDLAGRRYDGVAAVGSISAARLPVIGLARHDDQAIRRRALDAGAARVFSYDKFFRDGTRLVTTWFGPDDGPSRDTGGDGPQAAADGDGPDAA